MRAWLTWGVGGAALMALASLLGAPYDVSGADLWEHGVAAAQHVDVVRSMASGVLAPLGAWACCLGILGIFEGLRPAGWGVAAVASAGFSQWFVALGAHQAVRPLYAHLYRFGVPDPRLLDQATTYLNLLRSVAAIGLFAGSMFFFFAVLFRPTRFPRGAAWTVPILWVLTIRVIPALPAGPAAAWFAWLDLLAVAFFGSLLVLGRAQDA